MLGVQGAHINPSKVGIPPRNLLYKCWDGEGCSPFWIPICANNLSLGLLAIIFPREEFSWRRKTSQRKVKLRKQSDHIILTPVSSCVRSQKPFPGITIGWPMNYLSSSANSATCDPVLSNRAYSNKKPIYCLTHLFINSLKVYHHWLRRLT